jgi:hypothetical protein
VFDTSGDSRNGETCAMSPALGSALDSFLAKVGGYACAWLYGRQFAGIQIRGSIFVFTPPVLNSYRMFNDFR